MRSERTPWVPERLAGRGGLGEVWAAKDPASGLRVAMKVVPGLSGDRAPAFLDEVRAVATLHHPNVVRVFDLGMVDAAQSVASGGAFPVGAPFLVMEWVGGGILPAPATWAELEPALRVLLGALGHTHARGILHRDLKPANVLLSAPGDLRPGIKLVDFGLARLPGSRQAGPVTGTPAYMAPEQITGGHEGPWTDLFALGAMTWRLVTGEAPYATDSMERVLQARLTGLLPAFEPVIDVPAGLEAWLARLLARWPEQRFGLAADALHALDGIGPVVPGSRHDGARRPPRVAEATVSFDASYAALSERPGPASPTTPPDDRAEPTDRRPADPAPLPPLLPVPERWTPVPPDAVTWVGLTGLRLFGLRDLPMVGRVAERDHLWSALRATAASGLPRVLVLRGPAGVGKSRLARWLSEEVHALGIALPFHTGQGRPPARDTVIAGLVTRAVRLPDDARARQQAMDRHPLGEEIQRALADTGRLPARLAATLRVLRGVAGTRPILLWLDDAQWSATAVALALTLLREGAAGPVLAVLTVQEEALADRPVERAALDRVLSRPDATALEIGPLPAADLATLVDHLLPLEPITARFVRQHAAGNPFLAMRLLDAWISRGVLVETPRGLGVPALPELEHLSRDVLLADELEALLADRPAEEAVALERAAVLGDSVRLAEWVAALAWDGLPMPHALVDRLLDRGILRRAPESLTFAQGLFRVALRQRAARGGRESAHNVAAAEALLRTASRPDAEGRIGEHWLAAGHPDRAVAPLLAAARACTLVDAIGGAGVWLRAVRSALDAAAVPYLDTRRAEYLEMDMWLQCSSVSPAAGAEAAQRLVDWAQAAGDEYREIAGTVRRALSRAYVGDGSDALPALGACWARAQEFPIPLVHMVGDFYTAELRNRGRLADGTEVARALLKRGEAEGDRKMIGNALRHLATLARMQGDAEEATRLFERATPLQLRETWGYAEVLNNLGDLHREQGRFAEAATAYAEAARCFQEIGSFDASVPVMNLALVRIAEGRMDEADALLQRCVVSLVQTEQRRMEAIARSIRLAPLAHRGDRAAFGEELERSRAVLEASGYLDPDVASVLDRAAREARAQGWAAETQAAAAWAHAQWVGLGRAAQAEAVRAWLDAG